MQWEQNGSTCLFFGSSTIHLHFVPTTQKGSEVEVRSWYVQVPPKLSVFAPPLAMSRDWHPAYGKKDKVPKTFPN